MNDKESGTVRQDPVWDLGGDISPCIEDQQDDRVDEWDHDEPDDAAGETTILLKACKVSHLTKYVEVAGEGKNRSKQQTKVNLKSSHGSSDSSEERLGELPAVYAGGARPGETDDPCDTGGHGGHLGEQIHGPTVSPPTKYMVQAKQGDYHS